jgi:hypothetical protein
MLCGEMDAGLASLLRNKCNMQERRKSTRTIVDQTAYISSFGSSTRCVVRNISEDGAALEVPDPSHLPTQFELMTEADRVVRTCKVVWIMKNTVGVVFDPADTRPLDRV